MEQLTRADVALLMESLQVWEGQRSKDMLLDTLMGGMLSKDQDREKWRADQKRALEEAQRDSATRRERSVLLQAKLIRLRDSMDADAITRTS